ncbi:hypothetical protein C8J56DRAFT_737523, partial [Mycena floridula]
GSAGLKSKVFFIWGAASLVCLVFAYYCIVVVYSVLFSQTMTPRKSKEYRACIMRE